jgi:mono/diheme cytochrome c family protein
LALDYEALVLNLFHAREGTLQHLEAGKWILRFGAAPLVFLACVGLIYRLLQRFAKINNPIVGQSATLKFALGLAAFIPYAAFCAPLSRAASAWISIEVFWWIQWYDNINPAMDWISEFGPYFVFPSALTIGLSALLFVFNDPAKEKKRSWGAILARIPWRITVAAALIAAFVPGVISLIHASRVAFAPGLRTFETNCGQCHANSRPLYFIKTPVEWRRTVTRMQEMEKAPITDREREKAISFLAGMRSYSDRWTFATRCGACHVVSHLAWEKRRPEEWGNIAERIARWSPYYFRPDVRDQIAAHLINTRSDPTATLGIDASDYQKFHRLENACASCHSISRRYEKYQNASRDEISVLVRRMSGKMPTPLSEEEITGITQYYGDAISDMERFDKLFPHDRPLAPGGLPW